MAHTPSTSCALNTRLPNHSVAVAEENTVASASDAAKAPPNFRGTRYGKVALKKLSHLKNRNLDTKKEEDYMNRLATFLFIPAIREGVQNAKKGASGEDVLKEVYKHIAASQQFKDSMSEDGIVYTDAAVSTEATEKIRDIRTHDTSDPIYAPEDCPTPARHPDETATEPEELELPSPIIKVVKTIFDKPPSPSGIPVPKGPRIGLTSKAPCTPKGDNCERSPILKVLVLMSPAQRELDAMEQHRAEPLSEKSKSEAEQEFEPEQELDAEADKATKPESEMEEVKTVRKGKTTEKKKFTAGSNKRKHEDNRNSTPQTFVKPAASKGTTPAKHKVTKKPKFVADDSKSEAEQYLQNRKESVKVKEDRLPVKREKKSPHFYNQDPVVADIKSNDFLRVHAHPSFKDKIAAALTYNNVHIGIRKDPAPPQRDNKKRKHSQNNGDEENEPTPDYKKLNTGGNAPIPEKKNTTEARGDAELRALARNNSSIKSILEEIEKSSK